MDPADTLPPVEQDQNNRNEKDEPLFLQELLAICCGVISPKSLNGLNHCNFDNDFQIANQEQNIRDLLERLCYATEFEIEGWKKIVPLTAILNRYTKVPISMQINLKLENDLKLTMEKFYAVTGRNNDGKFNNNDFIDKTIKKSEIYRHFEKSNQKLAIYVSQAIPINERYYDKDYSSTKHISHCVVATGLEKRNGVECLVLENTTGSIEDNYIPVDFPLNEALEKKIKNWEPSDRQNTLSKYGFDLAKKKFQKLKDIDAKTFKKNNNGTDWFNMEKDGILEYQMFFVKGYHPIYKLKFLQS